MSDMRWEIYNSVRALPDGLWERTVAKGKCTTSAAFLAALAQTHREQKHIYLVAYQGEAAVACVMLNIMRYDLSLVVPEFVRRLVAPVRRVWPGFLTLKLAMTGTLETYGDHLWYDETRLTCDRFVTELDKQVRAYDGDHWVLVIRDFIASSDNADRLARIRNALVGHGFLMGDVFPVAFVPIGAFATPAAYLASLKSRDRYTIRKAIKQARNHGVRYEFVMVDDQLLDECYPLYLAVNQRATELRTAPLPRRFFTAVQAEHGMSARLLTARDASGTLVGFAMVLETAETMEVFAVGLAYAQVGNVISLYNLLWECIAEAICNRRQCVDLGVTNYFVKTRFGANIAPMKVFFRASNPLLDPLLAAGTKRLNETQSDSINDSRWARKSVSAAL